MLTVPIIIIVMLCQELEKHETAVTTLCISQPGLLLACFERIKSLIIIYEVQ